MGMRMILSNSDFPTAEHYAQYLRGLMDAAIRAAIFWGFTFGWVSCFFAFLILEAAQ